MSSLIEALIEDPTDEGFLDPDARRLELEIPRWSDGGDHVAYTAADKAFWAIRNNDIVSFREAARAYDGQKALMRTREYIDTWEVHLIQEVCHRAIPLYTEEVSFEMFRTVLTVFGDSLRSIVYPRDWYTRLGSVFGDLSIKSSEGEYHPDGQQRQKALANIEASGDCVFSPVEIILFFGMCTHLREYIRLNGGKVYGLQKFLTRGWFSQPVMGADMVTMAVRWNRWPCVEVLSGFVVPNADVSETPNGITFMRVVLDDSWLMSKLADELPRVLGTKNPRQMATHQSLVELFQPTPGTSAADTARHHAFDDSWRCILRTLKNLNDKGEWRSLDTMVENDRDLYKQITKRRQPLGQHSCYLADLYDAIVRLNLRVRV